MARSATRFTQADVAKALKGAIAAGFDVGAVEIGSDGAIRIVRANEKANNSPKELFDEWQATRAG